MPPGGCPSIPAPAERFLRHAEIPQDGLGWCYASAGAELITHRIGHPVSGVDLAVTYNYETYSNPLSRAKRKLGKIFGKEDPKLGVYEGGMIGQAIDYAKKRGICPAERMPSHLMRGQKDKTGFELRNVLLQVKNFGLWERQFGRRPSLREFSAWVECSDLPGMMPTGYKDFFPGLDVPKLYDLLVDSIGQDVNETMFQLARQHCEKQRISLKDIKVRKVKAERALWMQILDKRLDRGNVMGIEFSSAMLYRRLEGMHAGVVVARKFQDGQCMYLVRDSGVEGGGCRPYQQKLQAHCDGKTQSVWVPEQDLLRDLRRMTYVE